MYKVCFSKYKKYSDRVDKFLIGTEVAYTDAPISDIPEILSEYFAKKEQSVEITQIITIQGIVLASTKEKD